MGLINMLFKTVPSYEGEVVFNKDIESVAEAIKKKMTSVMAFYMQLCKNVSSLGSIELGFVRDRDSSTADFFLMAIDGNTTKVTIRINGVAKNCKEVFDIIVKYLNKKL